MRFVFRPRSGIVLSAKEAESLVMLCKRRKRGSAYAVVNIGLSRVEVEVLEDIIILPAGYEISLEELKLMTKDERGIYLISRDGVFKLEIRTKEYYYKLALFPQCKSPTVEISGIHMHRVSGIDPWDDARIKISIVGVKKGHKVLDICTGLGYTAINARLRGAYYVMSIEKDENVLHLARANPWSRRLSDPQIEIFLEDATEFVKMLESNSFDIIIHDPPRLSSRTSRLYSTEFYKELYRILRPHGKLFHYTGEPKKHRGINVMRSIARRLHEVGFIVKPERKALGVIAIK